MRQHTRRTHRLPWLLALVISVVISVCAMSGCTSESSNEDPPADESTTDEQADDEAIAEARDDMAKNREAFGLPLPPKVTSIEREGQRTRVVTTLSLDELADFYTSRLQDYEVLRPPQKLRVLGLREYMPEIYGRRFAGTVRLQFRPNRTEPKAQAGGQDGADEGAESAGADRNNKGGQAAYQSTKPLYKREKGERVLDRTADGELLAPGAKWGEPYTPPPGSPLHKKRYRSNWGKPYGTWVAQ